MASYSAPTTTQIQSWTGLNTSILNQSAGDLSTLLTELLGLAEAEVALQIGEDRFDSSSLTARQVSALQVAVAYRTAALFLKNPQVRDASGTQEPLLMDFDDLREAILHCEERADGLAGLVASGEAPLKQEVRQPFSSSDDRTFSRDMTW